MSINKFRLISAAVFILFSVSFTSPVLAQYDLNKAAQDLAQGSPISSPEKIFDILKSILKYLYTIFFILAVIFILIAAYNFLFAQGDPEKIKSARAQILWASVAIAIALISVGAAQIITSFLQNAISVPVAYAQIKPGTVPGAGQLGVPASPINEPSGIMNVIVGILRWVYTIFFVAAVLFLLFAAYNYLGAQGDPEKTKLSHSQLIWAAVAIAVALLSVGIVTIVRNFLEVPGAGLPSGGVERPSSVPQPCGPEVPGQPCVGP